MNPFRAKRGPGPGDVTVTDAQPLPPSPAAEPELTDAQREGIRVEAALRQQAHERREAALNAAWVHEARAKLEREAIAREAAAEQQRREALWLKQYREQMAREAASPDAFRGSDV